MQVLIFYNILILVIITQMTTWHQNLREKGYTNALLAPIPAIQATLAFIDDPTFHDRIIDHDTTLEEGKPSLKGGSFESK